MRLSAKDSLISLLITAFLASTALPGTGPQGDINGDFIINWKDLRALADRWLDPACIQPGCIEDLDGTDGVAMGDFSLMAGYWGLIGTNMVITEFMAENKYAVYTTVNGQRVYPDWIEIYNPGPLTINLSGWYLTDDRNDLAKWRLPARMMRPGDYMLVFASGIKQEDHRTSSPYFDGKYYHTNFQLDGGGEYLALVDPHKYVVHEYNSSQYSFDKFGYPDQHQDMSYGLYRGQEVYFGGPTPERANSQGYAEITGNVHFSHPGGTFVETLQLTLTTPTQGADIRYTTNGTVPTPSSPKYTAPLTLNVATEVIARAFSFNKAPGPFTSHTYIALANDVASFNSNIPIAIVDTYGQGVSGNGYTRSAGVFIQQATVGRSVRIVITNEADYAGRCGMRIRGSSTAGAPKKQYSFETWDERDQDEAASIFSLPADSDWVLYAPLRYDRALINNAFIYELSNQVGRYATRSRACELYLNTGGGKVTANDFWGLYYFMEKIRINEDRVDIPELKAWDSTVPEVSGGYILAIDRKDPDGPGFDTTRGTPQGGAVFTYVDPQEPHATSTQRLWIRNWINQFESVLYGSNWTDPVDGYAKFIDVNSHVDHSLLNLLAMNVDAFRLSGYMYKERDGKLFAGPIWDFDRAMDSTDGRDDNPQSWNGTGDGTNYFTYGWYGRFHQDIDFWQRYIDRWYELREREFSTQNVNNTIDMMATEIGEAAVRNYARWSGYPARFGGFQGEIAHIKGWLSSRSVWIDAQFVRPPRMTPDGGYAPSGSTVTLFNPNGSGTMYYTLQGSDPRHFGPAERGGPNAGDVAAGAIQYTGPITLTESTQIKARVLIPGRAYSPWSGLATVNFGVTPVAESLRITEIMYHPQDTGDPNDPNEEFIELMNIGAAELNLNLVCFTNGIHFTFPNMNLAPGAYVVVVKSRPVFEAQYPDFEGIIAGQYTGRLENAGERIQLDDATGRPILDFKYKDGWRKITDGGGYSLTIIDANDNVSYASDEGIVGNWKLDEGEGTVAIDSAGTNNGVIHGSPVWTAGRSGPALRFDGGDYITMGPIEPLTGTSFTAEMWVNPGVVTRRWNPVLTQHFPTGDGYYLYIYGNKPVFSVTTAGASTQTTSPEEITPNEWYHLAITNDGARMKLYVDTELKASVPSVGFTGSVYNACFGYDYAAPSYYIGILDDLRVYNRALAEHEFGSLSDPLQNWAQKKYWRASTFLGGSPGYDDNGIVPNPEAVVINEVLAHSHAEAADWIELYNTTDEQIDIGGWYLSDSDANLTKYRIQDGTKIDPHDYLIFREDTNFGQVAADPGRLTGFAFSENGEEAYLTSAVDGALAGFRAVEDFDASQTEVSFARYYKRSTGNYNFVAMSEQTPLAPNAYPKVGPIVINEIMYHPQTSDQFDEYVELLNISNQNVTLYNSQTDEPWKFTDGISYTFPAGIGMTLAPGQYLLVVKDVPSYLAKYGLPPFGVFILGPYAGRLSDGGEKLELSMPGDVNQSGVRQYIRADRVTYSDGRHPENVPGGIDLWPTEPDGNGDSLNRFAPALYGNDPNNWQSAPPSPGADTP